MAVPLTTTFKPPSQCTEEIWQLTYEPETFYGLLGGTGYDSCLPPSFTPTSTFFYSPGLYCPNGYQSACSSIDVVGDETATVVTCCPTEYSCQKGGPVPGHPWEYILGCTSACTSGDPRITVKDSSTTRINDCSVGEGLNAYSVQLKFRAADLVTTTLASTPSSPLPSSTPTSNIPTNTATTSPSNNTDLTTGAKAGIGIGAVLGIALIGAILYLAWILRRNSRNNSPSGGFDQSELVQQPHILNNPKTPDPRISMGNSLPYEQNQAQFEGHELSAHK